MQMGGRTAIASTSTVRARRSVAAPVSRRTDGSSKRANCVVAAMNVCHNEEALRAPDKVRERVRFAVGVFAAFLFGRTRSGRRLAPVSRFHSSNVSFGLAFDEQLRRFATLRLTLERHQVSPAGDLVRALRWPPR